MGLGCLDFDPLGMREVIYRGTTFSYPAIAVLLGNYFRMGMVVSIFIGAKLLWIGLAC